MTERTADAANDVGLAWFRVAVLYFLIAVVIGISMGMRENFSLLSPRTSTIVPSRLTLCSSASAGDDSRSWCSTTSFPPLACASDWK